jgi:hypothetical protein
VEDDPDPDIDDVALGVSLLDTDWEGMGEAPMLVVCSCAFVYEIAPASTRPAVNRCMRR